MTPQQIQQLVTEAWDRTGSLSLYVNAADRNDAFHRHFAALVLERAAKVCDEQLEIQTTEARQVVAACCASSIRNMAKGLR